MPEKAIEVAEEEQQGVHNNGLCARNSYVLPLSGLKLLGGPEEVVA